jgi:hypothetical protein
MLDIAASRQPCEAMLGKHLYTSSRVHQSFPTQSARLQFLVDTVAASASQSGYEAFVLLTF